MTTFQRTALLLTVLWLAIVLARFRRSRMVLIAGLLAVGLYTAAALARRTVTLQALGLGIPDTWLPTVAMALGWLGLMLVYSPLADRLATRWIATPPDLGSFRAIQQSRGGLIAGIALAWVLGGLLEELVFRGILLRSIASWLGEWLAEPVAAGIAACVAGVCAGLMHSYQGPRAVVIVMQLSVLFGVLFILGGYDLWAVVLCHGLYDTVAFVRFANKMSRYSRLDGDPAP